MMDLLRYVTLTRDPTAPADADRDMVGIHEGQYQWWLAFNTELARVAPYVAALLLRHDLGQELDQVAAAYQDLLDRGQAAGAKLVVELPGAGSAEGRRRMRQEVRSLTCLRRKMVTRAERMHTWVAEQAKQLTKQIPVRPDDDEGRLRG